MSSNFLHWDDTITALATPQGIGAIGVIRISGKKAFEIVNNIFPSKNILLENSHTLHVGFLKYENEIIDEVVVSIFKSPHSYTGEDVIEISCHGSQFIQQKILQIITSLGARNAKPGEFTQRAFLNGKIDLTQAEAVADLIASDTEAARKTALNNMRGRFSDELKNIREQLIKFSALIELELDFAQEDVEFADRNALMILLQNIALKVQDLLNSFQLGNVIKNGVQVAIIGKPNAGKSTLLNTLLNEDRAIVSEIAGTTRDTIEELININGILFKLIDTAGIREHSTDEIESIGVNKSFEKMHQADLVIYLFDVNNVSIEELTEQANFFATTKIKFLFVGNKDDVSDQEKKEKIFHFNHPIIFISAKENKNIEALQKALYDMVWDEKLFANNIIVTNARHIEMLKKILISLNDIIAGLNTKLSGDLLASDINACLHYIGEITGQVNTEEKLDYIFSKFCIGK